MLLVMTEVMRQPCLSRYADSTARDNKTYRSTKQKVRRRGAAVYTKPVQDAGIRL